MDTDETSRLEPASSRDRTPDFPGPERVWAIRDKASGKACLIAFFQELPARRRRAPRLQTVIPRGQCGQDEDQAISPCQPRAGAKDRYPGLAALTVASAPPPCREDRMYKESKPPPSNATVAIPFFSFLCPFAFETRKKEKKT